MARPREFDTDAALERAMEVFWSKGYEAASLDALCDAMALSRSSVYAAFGDKRALLLRSLTHYMDGGSERIGKALSSRLPVRTAIAGLLDAFIDAIIAGPGRRGCFLGNCAAELARDDGEAMAIVREGLRRNEARFRDALAAAQARGELKREADVAALARFLTAAIQGLRLVGKVNPDRRTLQDIARVMLNCLDE